MAEMDQVRVCP